MDPFITDTLQPLLVAIVTTIVPLLLALACRWFSKTTGIAISTASQQKLEDIATKSVLYVEEKASASLKTAAEKWPSYLKYQTAMDRVLSLAPSLSHDQADVLIHWALAQIPGIGSTGVLGATPLVAGTALLSPAATDPGAAPAAAVPAVTATPADSFLDMLTNLVASKLTPPPALAVAAIGGTNAGDTQLIDSAAAAAQ